MGGVEQRDQADARTSALHHTHLVTTARSLRCACPLLARVHDPAHGLRLRQLPVSSCLGLDPDDFGPDPARAPPDEDFDRAS